MDRRFRRALMGYRPRDVAARIAHLEAAFSAELEERRASEARQASANLEMSLQVQRLQAEIEQHRTRQAALARLLTAARAEAASIRQEAVESAEEMKAVAQARAASADAELARLRGLHELFCKSLEAVLVEYEARAQEAMTPGDEDVDVSSPVAGCATGV